MLNNHETIVTADIDLGTAWLQEYLLTNNIYVENIDYKSKVKIRFFVSCVDGYITVRPHMIDNQVLINNMGVILDDGFIST